MSETFASVSVRTDDHEAVYDLLDDGEAFISPPILGWVTVFDRQAAEGDLARLTEIAARLSGALRCAAIALMVMQGEVFFYLLFEDGTLQDEYASDPDFFGEAAPEEREALRGQPERLLPYAIPGVRADHLRAVLETPSMPAVDRCRALASRLGIENATLGFADLAAKAEGADIEVVGWELFDYTGGPPFEELDSHRPDLSGHSR
ncbi:MAG: hypothetical protein RMM58_05445 [Chloroflexota bacterium]|nr:hypothetical protein [Dehalococcoidia bacterium]MDW8253308.1 hypothetical protein [Chloroflexota bacterium]